MLHPLIDHADRLNRLHGPAEENSYTMASEWDPRSHLLVTWPNNQHTWPNLKEAQTQYQQIIYHAEKVCKILDIKKLNQFTSDAWIRDFGPILLMNNVQQKALADFYFNCWGGRYQPYTVENNLPQHIALELHKPLWIHDFVLEGGAIESNGQGTIMATQNCLLDQRRNPGYTLHDVEAMLRQTLGAKHIVWLPGMLTDGDDTGGHIDNLARFIDPTTIIAVHPTPDHHDYQAYHANWLALQNATNRQGHPFKLIELPAVPKMTYHYPSDPWNPAGSRTLPASYANFLIINDLVLFPTFGQPTDQLALQAIEQAMPNHQIIALPSDQLIVGQGGIHCLTCAI